jgi:hypothetical protein
MDAASIRDLVCKEVMLKFGDSVNTRGIVVLPISPLDGKGVVQFNVMDSRDSHYGLNRVSYRIDFGGKVRFTQFEQTS